MGNIDNIAKKTKLVWTSIGCSTFPIQGKRLIRMIRLSTKSSHTAWSWFVTAVCVVLCYIWPSISNYNSMWITSQNLIITEGTDVWFLKVNELSQMSIICLLRPSIRGPDIQDNWLFHINCVIFFMSAVFMVPELWKLLPDPSFGYNSIYSLKQSWKYWGVYPTRIR